MYISYDGTKKLTIHGVEHNIDDIYAFDIANINDYNHLRLIKKSENIILHKSADAEDCIKQLKLIKRQLRKLNCEQFALIDYVIVNMDKIKNVVHGKDSIMIEFDEISFSKKVDVSSKTAFMKKYDMYLASNMSNSIR